MDSSEAVAAAPMDNASEPQVHTLFEATTRSWQWIVADPSTKDAIIIDPVLDRVPKSSGICTSAADRLLALVSQYGYRVVRILETNAQGENRTSAWYLRTQLRDGAGNMPRICTGQAIAGVQRMFERQYRITDPGWGKHFDSSFRDGQVIPFGRLECLVVQVSEGSFAFVVGHNVFVGEVPQGDAAKARLGEYMDGYFWHPDSEETRPPTMQTTVSGGWQSPRPSWSSSQRPYSPLASGKHERGLSNAPASRIYEMAG